MRRLRWISGIVWIFSWYTVYLEVFRWHHMTKSLRFNPPPPIPGTNFPPRAGMPLITVCLSSVVAPLVFITATIVKRARSGHEQAPLRERQAPDRGCGLGEKLRGRVGIR